MSKLHTKMPFKKCIHGSNVRVCIPCADKRYICEHKRVKYYCKQCLGNGICKHLKRITCCVDCGGGSLCFHGILRTNCKHCGKNYLNRICKHGKKKYQCIQCGNGTQICIHLKRKSVCKECNGSEICQHKKQIRTCLICSPFKYFANRVRAAVKEALRRKVHVKNRKTLNFLGVDSFEKFQAYFKDKIDKWNEKYPDNSISNTNLAIDHIKPVAAFDDSEKAKREVNHYTNLQPLPRDVNGHKSAKWSDKDEEFWRANIIGNAEFREIYLPCVMD